MVQDQDYVLVITGDNAAGCCAATGEATGDQGSGQDGRGNAATASAVVLDASSLPAMADAMSQGPWSNGERDGDAGEEQRAAETRRDGKSRVEDGNANLGELSEWAGKAKANEEQEVFLNAQDEINVNDGKTKKEGDSEEELLSLTMMEIFP